VMIPVIFWVMTLYRISIVRKAMLLLPSPWRWRQHICPMVITTEKPMSWMLIFFI